MTDKHREEAGCLLHVLGSHVNPPPHVKAAIQAVEFTWREGQKPMARIEYSDGTVSFMDDFQVR